MKTLFALFLSLLTTTTFFAQNVWQGGFPGHENDWQCARNWSAGRVPGEFDQVTIPDCSARGDFYPVIAINAETVQCMTIHSGARLTIARTGHITINGIGVSGASLLNLGTIRNDGILEVIEPAIQPLAYNGNGLLIHRRNDLVTDFADIGD